MRHCRRVFLVAFLFAVLGALASTRLPAAPRPVELVDLFAIKDVTQVAISPDGHRVAYVVTAPDGQGNLFNVAAELWLLDVQGGEPRRILTERVRAPAWTPDGRSLAYIAGQEGAGPRVWLHDVTSGARRALNTLPEGANPEDQHAVSSFSWSPGGDRLAFIGNLNAPLDRNALPPEVPKVVIKDVPSAQGVLGYAGLNVDSFLGVLEVDTGRSVRVTRQPVVAFGYGHTTAWSGDGERLLFIGQEGKTDPGSGSAALLHDLFIADLASARVERVGGTAGRDWDPVWSAQEDAVIFLGDESGDEPYDHAPTLRRLDLATGRVEVLLDEGVSVQTSLTELPGRNEIVVARLVSADRRLDALSMATKKLRAASPEDMYVVDYSIAADGDTVAAILTSANTPPDVYLGSLSTGKYRRLTDLYAEERERLAFAPIERIQWPSQDGRFTIEGFLVKPPDFEPEKKYPLLVNVHGGPGGDYWNNFHQLRFSPGHHSQVEFYAAHGYLVLQPNPRGSVSYGKEFYEALREGGRHGTSYDLDIAPGVDHLIRLGFVDEDKLGIMGASYGGYVAAWAVTQTQRYKAVSINDSMFNLLSFFGTMYPDFREYHRYFLGGNPLEVLDRYAKNSPVFLAGNIRTPTLIRCGAQGGSSGWSFLSSPFCSQSLELYAALREQDVPVELILHPQEGHGILDAETSRDYLVRNLDWFNFWLKGEEDPDPAKAKQYQRWRELKRLQELE